MSDLTSQLAQILENGIITAPQIEALRDEVRSLRSEIRGQHVAEVATLVMQAVAPTIPNYQHIVTQMAADYPAEWQAAHTGGPQTEAFIRRLAYRLWQMDPRIGLNGKRGNPNDISDDALCFDGVAAGGDYDPTRGGVPVTVIDVIAAAGGPNPAPAWAYPLTPAAAAWVRPQPVEDGTGDGGGDGPVDPPTPEPCRFEAEALDAIEASVYGIQDDMAGLHASLTRAETEVIQLRTLVQTLIMRLEEQGLSVEIPAGRWLGTFRGTARLPRE